MKQAGGLIIVVLIIQICCFSLNPVILILEVFSALFLFNFFLCFSKKIIVEYT